MSQEDLQNERIEQIIGNDDQDTFIDCRDKFFKHLESCLELPCHVTGTEDFQWEEFYVIGPGDPKEYAKLRKDRPSYKDIYELLAIEAGVQSEWMLFRHEDIAAIVRRKSDGKRFCLGLSELKAVDKKSKNYQLLDDYAVWLVNSR